MNDIASTPLGGGPSRLRRSAAVFIPKAKADAKVHSPILQMDMRSDGESETIAGHVYDAAYKTPLLSDEYALMQDRVLPTTPTTPATPATPMKDAPVKEEECASTSTSPSTHTEKPVKSEECGPPMPDQSNNHARNAIIQLFLCFLSGYFPPDTYAKTFPTDSVKYNAFDCRNAPCITPTDYFARIAKFSGCSAETMIRAFCFVVKPDDPYQPDRPSFTARSVHRLLLTAVAFCAKFYDDFHISLEHYAKIGGIELSELVHLEEIFFSFWADDLFQPGCEGMNVTWNFLARIAFTIPRYHPQIGGLRPDSRALLAEMEQPVPDLEPHSILLNLARKHLSWGCVCSGVSDEIYTFIMEMQAHRNAFVKEFQPSLMKETKAVLSREDEVKNISTPAQSISEKRPLSEPKSTTLVPRIKPPRARPGGGNFKRRLRSVKTLDKRPETEHSYPDSLSISPASESSLSIASPLSVLLAC